MFYLFILFVVLSPGVILTLPPNSGHLTSVLVHAVIFIIIWEFTYKPLWRFFYNEDFEKTMSMD
jgi:hypothetical protein